MRKAEQRGRNEGKEPVILHRDAQTPDIYTHGPRRSVDQPSPIHPSVRVSIVVSLVAGVHTLEVDAASRDRGNLLFDSTVWPSGIAMHRICDLSFSFETTVIPHLLLS